MSYYQLFSSIITWLSVLYKEVLPIDGVPPSFMGSAVKYQYKLILSAQKLGSEIRTVKLPLRVLILPGKVN